MIALINLVKINRVRLIDSPTRQDVEPGLIRNDKLPGYL